MVKRIYNEREIKKYAQEYVRYLQSELKLSVQASFIFGSYARGKAHRWSDIDICIISSQFKNEIDALQYLSVHRRLVDIERGIEPHGFSTADFNKLNSPLIVEIKKTGIRV